MNKRIKYWVFDVDGTMTDGGIYYDENGNEIKKFCTKDAAAFFVAHKAGMKIIVLTGRSCEATTRRMRDLHVDFLFQEVKDKYNFLLNFMQEHGVAKDELGYIGDDLNDIPSMQLAKFIGCPADSCREVIEIADYVSPVKGGYGAVRDIIEYVMRERGQWTEMVSEVYGIGI